MTPDEIENKVFTLVRRGYDPSEVDEFLSRVASALAQAQGGLATATGAPPTPPSPPDDSVAVSGPDDFGRLGEEVAAILRQAHDSVDALRHRAEAEAALIRQEAQREADELRRQADADRQAAAIEREAAQAESARVMAEVQRQVELAAESGAALARERSRQVVDTARTDASDAVTVQRRVRRRLLDARADIDGTVDKLADEDTDLFADLDLTGPEPVVDLSDEADDDGPDGPDDVPPPGQGPPTPPVPPPARPPSFGVDDLPYATDDEPPADEDDTLIVDLRDDGDGDLDEGLDGDDGPDGPDGPDDGPPPPPPPPPGFDPGPGGAAATPPPAEGEDEDDALSRMVKNAVENALRRRKGDADPSGGTGS